MKKILLVLTFLIVLSCGRSPFLKEEPSAKKPTGTGEKIIVDVEIDIPGTDRNGQRSTPILKYILKGLWDEGPSISVASTLLVIITDQNGKKVDTPLDFSVYIWMPGMGHGSAPVKVTKLAQGMYEISNIFFIMGGLWDIHFEFKKDGKLVEEVIWPLEL